MTSALEKWQSLRLVRFDRLLAAHPHSVGSTADPAVAQEWTHALILLLASEFQGFCRDLHDDEVEAIARGVAGHDAQILDRITIGLSMNRGLNRRGADAQTLKDDFLRLGTPLWANLQARHPAVAPAWLTGLAYLQKARNGLSHDDAANITTVQAAGWVLQIETVWRWRKLVDEVATAMAYIVNTDIADLFVKNQFQ